ncbi:MAG TPA: peroxiredoxin [Elusimicrobiota bacterium]|jgi:peroxiredoxin (alkyl hydroperoxide reductase subunit C)|nr:peroxiredoxin [Elusimicrobiota bacterium]
MSETLVQKAAPDFKAQAVVNKLFKEVKLEDFKGKWLVLFFYPLDFTFVCPTEITSFSDHIDQFHKLNCEVVGCSVDSQFTHLAWINTPRKEGGLGEIKYPLLADISKKIARDYGVLVNDSIALRGLFLINPKGQVAYSVVHDLGVGRSVEETLRVLKAFQQVEKTGEVCPANWNEGKKTMKADPAKSKEYFAAAA